MCFAFVCLHRLKVWMTLCGMSNPLAESFTVFFVRHTFTLGLSLSHQWTCWTWIDDISVFFFFNVQALKKVQIADILDAENSSVERTVCQEFSVLTCVLMKFQITLARCEYGATDLLLLLICHSISTSNVQWHLLNVLLISSGSGNFI